MSETCQQCGGLQMEPGVPYSYAGRVCYCGWKSRLPTPSYPFWSVPMSPVQQRPEHDGCRPVQYVDEHRVREIIREELAKLKGAA